MIEENIQNTIDEIRKEIACCCSWHRHVRITELLDRLESELDDNIAPEDPSDG